MRLFSLLTSVALAGWAAADAVNDLEAKGRPALDAAMAKSTTCSKDKLAVRREWYVRSTWICGTAWLWLKIRRHEIQV